MELLKPSQPCLQARGAQPRQLSQLLPLLAYAQTSSILGAEKFAPLLVFHIRLSTRAYSAVEGLDDVGPRYMKATLLRAENIEYPQGVYW